MSWNVGIIKKRLNPDSTILLHDQTPDEEHRGILLIKQTLAH